MLDRIYAAAMYRPTVNPNAYWWLVGGALLLALIGGVL